MYDVTFHQKTQGMPCNPSRSPYLFQTAPRFLWMWTSKRAKHGQRNDALTREAIVVEACMAEPWDVFPFEMHVTWLRGA